MRERPLTRPVIRGVCVNIRKLSWSECNDKLGSLTPTACISRSFQNPPESPALCICQRLQFEKSKRHCADDKSMFRLMGLRKNVYAVRCFLRCIIASNATPPTAIIDNVEGSGTDAPTFDTKRLLPDNASGMAPVMKLALITAPVVASYSTVLVK